MGLRNDLQAWHNGDSLVAQVARNNNNTIVVVNSVGPLILEKWINHPNGELDRFFLCLSELSITAFATSFSDCGSTYNLDSRPVTNFVIDTSPRSGQALLVRKQVRQDSSNRELLIHSISSGNSLVDVLYGSYNPSGRLPYTIARDQADYPAQVRFELSGRRG